MELPAISRANRSSSFFLVLYIGWHQKVWLSLEVEFLPWFLSVKGGSLSQLNPFLSTLLWWWYFITVIETLTRTQNISIKNEGLWFLEKYMQKREKYMHCNFPKHVLKMKITVLFTNAYQVCTLSWDQCKTTAKAQHNNQSLNSPIVYHIMYWKNDSERWLS